MAPTRPKGKKSSAKARAKRTAAIPPPQRSSAKQLLAEATALLEQGDAATAATAAKAALNIIGEDGDGAGAALTLQGEIHVEMGDIEAARSYFERAAHADPDGALPDERGGGVEKFLWLAQLSEEGGRDSVRWYERGAEMLRRQIRELKDGGGSADAQQQAGAGRGDKAGQTAGVEAAGEKKRRLADTLCAVAEVYMTDLSWEEDAERRCEALVTEATLLAPESPGVWQTVANVRISQTRTGEARAALERSLALWAGLPPEDPGVPAFPARVSLARLLMEVEMEGKAVEVVERLVVEDDGSVEAWYLGGFALFVMGEKQKEKKIGADDSETWEQLWKHARRWLAQCLRLFAAQDYEDKPLGLHARELLDSIGKELGNSPVDDDDGEEDDWEDEDNDDGEDEEMQ